jgi:hypothetical protein
MNRIFRNIVIFLFIFEITADEVAPGVLRTPDSYFEDLKDYPFESNYIMIDGLRIHYLDEGPKDADPIILLHGLPTMELPL